MRPLAMMVMYLSLTVIATSVVSNSGSGIGPARQVTSQGASDRVGDEPTTLSGQPAVALMGTGLLDHSEEIEAIRGDPRSPIDYKQYNQITAYLLGRIDATPAERDKIWQPNFSSAAAYQSSLSEHRQHLRRMLGLIQPTAGEPEIKVLQEDSDVRVEEVVIPITTGLRAQALLFLPLGSQPKAAVIAIPPANQTPEDFAGIAEGREPANWLTSLLEHNVVVAVPDMVERLIDHPLCHDADEHDRRRLLWRLGFIVGRTLVGIEVQQVLAVRDFLSTHQAIGAERVAVLGQEQGGMTALYTAAVDEKLAGTTIIDYFEQREGGWKEPVDRVIYGQLKEFGDAEVGALIAPHPLTILTTVGSEIPLASVKLEVRRARRFYLGLGAPAKLVVREKKPTIQ